jgi:hypothetical protein
MVMTVMAVMMRVEQLVEREFCMRSEVVGGNLPLCHSVDNKFDMP